MRVLKLSFFFTAWRMASIRVLFVGALFYCIALPMNAISGQSAAEGEANQSLALVGYNYTDKDIDSYSVNGVGGGDIRLSTKTSGGGGIVCCVDYSSIKYPNKTVRVRWQVDGCIYILKNQITGATQKVRHLSYKEALAPVADLSNGKARYIETHLYRDGTVRVLLTREISSPLVRLDGNRPDQSSFPRCENDRQPR